MPINFFTIVLIGMVTYILCRRNTLHRKFIELLSLTIIIHISAIRGYFLLVGKSSEVSYDVAMSFILLLFCIYYLFKKHFMISKKGLLYVYGFFFFAIISVLYEYFFPYENLIMNSATSGINWDAYIFGIPDGLKSYASIKLSRLITYFIIATSYFFTLLIAKYSISKNDLLYIIKKIKCVFPYVMVLGFIEYISKNYFGGVLYEIFMGLIFGTGSGTFTTLIERGGGYQLQGVSNEPAHFSFMLYWGIVFLLIEHKLLTKIAFSWKEKIEVLLMLILMYLSGSFSSYVYFIILLLFAMWIYQRQIHTVFLKGTLITLGGLLLAGLIYIFVIGVDTSSYLGQRIASVYEAIDLISIGTVSGVGGSSVLARLVSIHDTAWDFFQRPLLGLGPTVQISHGVFVNLLSDVGIVGLLFWCKATFSVHHYKIIPIIILLLMPNVFMGVLTISTAFASYTIFIMAVFRKSYADNKS